MQNDSCARQRTGIEQILEDVISQDGAQTGLVSLPGPTGIGKTESVARFMAGKLIAHGDGARRMVFITSTKRNLPAQRVRDILDERGHPELKRLVLYLDSNADMLLNGVEEARKLIGKRCARPYEYHVLKRGAGRGGSHGKPAATRRERFDIGNLPELAAAEKAARLCREAQGLESAAPDVRKMAVEGARKQLEEADRALRHAITGVLRSMADPKSGQLCPKDEKLRLVEHDDWWAWLRVLYPSVLSTAARAIFMSVDKALVRNSTIVESSEEIWTGKLLEGAVVFVDEFDRSKATINAHLIGEGTRHMYDPVELFRTFFGPAFEGRAFSDELMRVLKWQAGRAEGDKEGRPRVKTLLGDYTALCEAARNAAEELHLDKQFRLDGPPGENGPFLFVDATQHIVAEGRNWAAVEFREDVNILRTGSGKPPYAAEEGTGGGAGRFCKVTHLLSRLDGLLRWGAGWVARVAELYIDMGRKQAEEGRRPEMDFDQAASTVLSELNIMNEPNGQRSPARERLMDMAREERTRQAAGGGHKERGGRASSADLCLHQTGFTVCSIAQSPDFDTIARMQRCGITRTAESMLVELCQRSLVVGISATIDIPSVLANYDMDYVRGELGEGFLALTPERLQLIQGDYDRSICHYDKVSIRVHPVKDVDDTGRYCEAAWRHVLSSDRRAREAFNMVGQACGDEYLCKRVLRVANVYAEFRRLPRARAMLCMLNKLPKEGDPTLPTGLLNEVFGLILRDQGHDGPAEDTWAVLGGGGSLFESRKRDILERLSAGDKLFVVTAYLSAGAGQNLQYRIPAGREDKLVTTNDRPPSEEMDFDCLYLDAPTHTSPVLSVEAGEPASEEAVLGHILQCEYLYESPRLEASAAQLRASVRDALGAYNGTPPKTQGMYMDTPSALMDRARATFQAAGRLARTNRKMPEVHIFAAEDVLPGVDIGELRGCGVMFTPEFEALASGLGATAPARRGEGDTLERQRERACAKSRSLIYSMLGSGWDAGARATWAELGEQVLRWPTLPEGWDGPPHLQRCFYAQFERPVAAYPYTSEGDFREVRVLEPGAVGPGARTVSEAEARLEQLMRIPGMREHFESLGYATQWAPSTLVMTPIVAESIYKGRLGEACGRFILESCGIAVEGIDEAAVFEKFDFVLPAADAGDSPGTYIDFKHWKRPSDREGWESERLLDWVFQKMEQVGATRAIVANVLPPSGMGHERVVRELGGRRLLTVPSLVSADFKVDAAAIQKIREFHNGN